ncbi:MAG: tetratricopeptide repeat protein [Pseudomonadota bacterium]
MAAKAGNSSTGERRSSTALAAALAASLMMSACAQIGSGGPDLLASGVPSPKTGETPEQSLALATTYWGKKFSENPRDLKTGLAYAKNLKAMGDKQRALAVLQQLAVLHGQSRELASEYGRLALDLDQVQIAKGLLEAADDPANPDWRVIAARGTAHAKEGEYKKAIPFYERALALAPDHPSLLNNLALAHTMNGEAVKAEEMLRQASASSGANPRVRQNLALVLGLQGRYDESQQMAAKDQPVQVAAADTQIIRQIVRLDPKSAPGEAIASAHVAKGGPALKPSAATDTAVVDAGGWATKVAASDPAPTAPLLKPAAR